MTYREFLDRKAVVAQEASSIVPESLHPSLFPFQRDCLEMLLGVGRGAAFLDTGLGKTILQCEWARHIPGDVLIVAPLAVGQQTVHEAETLLGMDIAFSRDGAVDNRVTVTNYERVHNFDTGQFSGVVLDESSILKGKNSKTKDYLTEAFSGARFKLCCTATPAPNDYTEIGNHASFLGLMSAMEMLSRWFIHDSANTADWRLKGHAVKPFWEWVSSWAACVSKPSDLGYSDDGYDLPPVRTETHVVKAPTTTAFDDGMLFEMPEVSATGLHAQKRKTVEERCRIAAELANASSEPWIVWCESNEESSMLAKLIPDAVEVKGSDDVDKKEDRLVAFTEGRARVIITKSSIAGFGLNWQHCQNMVFASISYSYERFYQAVRRCWRFGQKGNVNVHVVIADAELPVWRAVERKAMDHKAMKDHMKFATFKKGQTAQVKVGYNPTHKARLPQWLVEDNRTKREI